VPRSKNEWSYTSTPPISLHGAQLKGSTGTTLPFTFTLITKNKLDEEQNGFQEGSSCSVGNLKLTQVL